MDFSTHAIWTSIVCFTSNRHACLELVIVGFACAAGLLNGGTNHTRSAPSTIGRRLLDLTSRARGTFHTFARSGRDTLGLFSTPVTVLRLDHFAEIARATLDLCASLSCMNQVDSKADQREKEQHVETKRHGAGLYRSNVRYLFTKRNE